MSHMSLYIQQYGNIKGSRKGTTLPLQVYLQRLRCRMRDDWKMDRAYEDLLRIIEVGHEGLEGIESYWIRDWEGKASRIHTVTLGNRSCQGFGYYAWWQPSLW